MDTDSGDVNKDSGHVNSGSGDVNKAPKVGMEPGLIVAFRDRAFRVGARRSEFINGRNEIIAFLSRKWARELDYRLIKEMWAFMGNRIAVRFSYEWHDDSGHWYRSYGNENWEFNDDGLMNARFASINDLQSRN